MQAVNADSSQHIFFVIIAKVHIPYLYKTTTGLREHRTTKKSIRYLKRTDFILFIQHKLCSSHYHYDDGDDRDVKHDPGHCIRYGTRKEYRERK